jgi:hypothetical protein
MVIGTSAIIDTAIDGAVGMNSGIFNNPFMIWGKYRKKLFRYYLPVSFQFHHTQMDGAHAGRFLENLQSEINNLRREVFSYETDAPVNRDSCSSRGLLCCSRRSSFTMCSLPGNIQADSFYGDRHAD